MKKFWFSYKTTDLLIPTGKVHHDYVEAASSEDAEERIDRLIKDDWFDITLEF